MDDLVMFMKQRRRADAEAAADWAARTATITAWAQKVVTLLQRHGIPAEQTLFDRVNGEKRRIASGWLIRTVQTPSATGPLKEIGILLTPAGDLWQYDQEWPLSVRLTPQLPNVRTQEGAIVLTRCEFVLDHAIEAFADALDRHNIDIAELEALA